MIALKIQNKKDFMSKLLKGDTFDLFWMVEASITTSNTYNIDGLLHLDFFDEEERKSLTEAEQVYSYWKANKDLCFSIIRGSHLPRSFKFVFQQPRKGMLKTLAQSGCSLSPEEVNGLYLNLVYKEEEILCTTGTSIRVFTLDKTLEKYWDKLVLSYFNKQNISFEELS